MKGTLRVLLPVCFLLMAVCLLLPAVLGGCKEDRENGEKELLKRQLDRSEAKYEAVERELETEKAKTRAAHEDLYVAAVICFCLVLAIFLLLQLVLRAQRNKKALLRFLQWLQRRSWNGK